MATKNYTEETKRNADEAERNAEYAAQANTAVKARHHARRAKRAADAAWWYATQMGTPTCDKHARRARRAASKAADSAINIDGADRR